MNISELARESKNGEIIFLSKTLEYWSISRKKADDLIAFPLDVFATKDEAIEFAKKYLDEHPDTGLDLKACVEE